MSDLDRKIHIYRIDKPEKYTFIHQDVLSPGNGLIIMLDNHKTITLLKRPDEQYTLTVTDTPPGGDVYNIIPV